MVSPRIRFESANPTLESDLQTVIFNSVLSCEQMVLDSNPFENKLSFRNRIENNCSPSGSGLGTSRPGIQWATVGRTLLGQAGYVQLAALHLQFTQS